MHELSLAQSLIDQLLDLADEHGADRITRLSVTIGPFSGIVADSFSFGFNALKEEHHSTKEAVLLLELPEPEYQCLDCQTTTTIALPSTDVHLRAARQHMIDIICKHCSSTSLAPTGGTELILKQIEME